MRRVFGIGWIAVLAAMAMSGCGESSTPTSDAGGGADASMDAAPLDASMDASDPVDAIVPVDATMTPDGDTPCEATQYRDASGACTDLTVCGVMQFESTAPTATSDRICTDLTVCGVMQFESMAPTATSDRGCSDVIVCSATQYELMPPTVTSNRVCSDLTICADTQYESTAPSATTDRVCSDLTVCTASQYESTAPSATSDRVCSDLTDCAPGEYVASAPTATSDRVCAPCERGSYSGEVNATSCLDTMCRQTVRGGVAPTGSLSPDACAAGELASAVAVQSEGRGFVNAVRIGCSTVSGNTVGPVRWPAGAPPGSYVRYECPAGRIVSGLTVNRGDIIDRVGVRCHVPNWSNDQVPTSLGLAASATNVRTCPAGNGLVQLASASVSYFGAPVLAQINMTCAASDGTSTITRAGGQDAVLTTSPFATPCPAGQVAVGIGVGREGRGFVRSFNVQCATLNADRMSYGTPTTVGTLTGTANMATCPAGQQLVGITAATGDILDRLGAICRPIDWTSASPSTTLGPFGAGATTATSCPDGQVITGLSGRTVSYFGGTTASAVTARCAPLACP